MAARGTAQGPLTADVIKGSTVTHDLPPITEWGPGELFSPPLVVGGAFGVPSVVGAAFGTGKGFYLGPWAV